MPAREKGIQEKKHEEGGDRGKNEERGDHRGKDKRSVQGMDKELKKTILF